MPVIIFAPTCYLFATISEFVGGYSYFLVRVNFMLLLILYLRTGVWGTICQVDWSVFPDASNREF